MTSSTQPLAPSKRRRLVNRRSLIVCSSPLACGRSAVVGIIGIAPGATFGLKTTTELYLFGIIHGLNLGPIQAFGRSLYARPDAALPSHHPLAPSLLTCPSWHVAGTPTTYSPSASPP